MLVSGSAGASERDALRTELFGLVAQEPWAGGVRDHFVEVVPERLTGRRVFLA